MIAAQIIGVIAVLSMIISFTRRQRRQILVWQIIVTVLWTVHFLLLGVPTGAATNGSLIVRNIIFHYKEDKKWAQSSFWLRFFIAVAVVIGILTGDSALSILPVVGSILSTVSMWMKKPLHIRLLTLPVSVCWIIYNAVSGSVAGVCNEVIAIVTILSAVVRIDLPARKATTELK